MTDLLDSLASLAWAASGATLAMLLLRRALRHWFGAALAYQGWLIVPVAMLATFLPLAPQHAPIAPLVLHLATYTGPALAHSGGTGWAGWVMLAWAAGAFAAALWYWREHVAFVRSLGPLAAREGIFYGVSNAFGPALVGLWRPRVVVPADFAQRYTAREQALIVAHERSHVRRGDTVANAMQAVLQCLFWFNPIMYFAAGRFRFDQELACDAAVMRAHPKMRRAYAAAMLKTQSVSTATPSTLSCSWHSNHPLKERIMTLKKNPPHAARRFTGRLLITALVCAGGYSTLAARAETAPAAGANTYAIAMTLTTAGDKSAPRLQVKEGEPFKIATNNKGVKFVASFVLTAAAKNTVKLAGTVECGNAKPAHPVLLTALGEPATVKVAETGAPGCELAMVVTKLAEAAAAK